MGLPVNSSAINTRALMLLRTFAQLDRATFDANFSRNKHNARASVFLDENDFLTWASSLYAPQSGVFR